jgi:hypothetical protein
MPGGLRRVCQLRLDALVVASNHPTPTLSQEGEREMAARRAICFVPHLRNGVFQ